MSVFPRKEYLQPSALYISLKISLQRFHAPFSQLTTKQRRIVQREVQKEYDLQQKILNTAEAKQVRVDKHAVNQAVTSIRNRYPDRQSFDTDLRNNGLTSTTLQQALTEELMAEQVLVRVAEGAPPVTDKKIKAYYQANKDFFCTQEERFARHILITINPAFPENSPANAQKRLTSIQRQLKKEPARFPNLAAHYSECPSALKKGELGRVGRGALFSQLEDSLFQLAEGEISGIVTTEMGLHLLFCEKIWPAESLSLHEARHRIQTALEKKHRRTHQKNWLMDLMDESPA